MLKELAKKEAEKKEEKKIESVIEQIKDFIKDNKVTLPLNEKKMSVNIYIREIRF